MCSDRAVLRSRFGELESDVNDAFQAARLAAHVVEDTMSKEHRGVPIQDWEADMMLYAVYEAQKKVVHLKSCFYEALEG